LFLSGLSVIGSDLWRYDIKTKKYNILKAEYRRLAYQLKDAYGKNDNEFIKSKKELIPRMDKVAKEIDKELEAMAKEKVATVARLLPPDQPF